MVLECFCSFPSSEANCNQLEELNMIQHIVGTQWGSRTMGSSRSSLPRFAPDLTSLQTPVTSIIFQVPDPLGASRTLWDTLRGGA